MPRSFLGLLLLAACSSPAKEEQPQAPAREAPPPLQPQPVTGDIYRTSRETGFDDMLEELAKAQVVYVGESHTNPEHHEIQLRILEALFEKKNLHGIGMEMFQRRFQPVLDDWVEGRIGEQELLERCEWKKRWAYDFALYRPILKFARDKRIPVIALNVERETRKLVSKGGLDAVPEDVRRTLPALYTDDAQHRAYLKSVYFGHPTPKSEKPKTSMTQEEKQAAFERFYLVMCLWDDVMADSVVRWFRAAPEGGQIVVLAGSGHLANRYGIPGRAFRRNGKPYSIVILIGVDEEPPPAADFARRYADFVWLTGPTPKRDAPALSGSAE